MKNLAAPVLLVVALLLTACGGSIEAEPTPSISTAGEVAADAGTNIPKPTAEQEAKLLAEIEKINPDFINRKTVGNARNQCTSILGKSPETSLIKTTKVRFEGLGVEAVTDTQANQLLDVIRGNGFCK